MSSPERSPDSLFRQIGAEKKPQGYKKKHQYSDWRDVSSKSPEKIQGVVTIIKEPPIWENKKLVKKFNKKMSHLKGEKRSRTSKTNNALGRRYSKGRRHSKGRKTRRHKKSRTYKK